MPWVLLICIAILICRFFWISPSDAKVRQGITTELLGQDGLGPAPVNKDSLNTIKGF